MRLALALFALGLFPIAGAAQVSDEDRQLRTRFANLYTECKQADAEFCASYGHTFHKGKIRQDGQLVDTVQSNLLAADFFGQACVKQDAVACDFAAALYYPLKGSGVQREVILKMADRGCRGGRGEACLIASKMFDTGDGNPRDAALAVKYAEQGCKLGDERSCEFHEVIAKILRLETELRKVEENMELLDETQEILSDPDLNK